MKLESMMRDSYAEMTDDWKRRMKSQQPIDKLADKPAMFSRTQDPDNGMSGRYIDPNGRTVHYGIDNNQDKPVVINERLSTMIDTHQDDEYDVVIDAVEQALRKPCSMN
jgi:hypothetical protein